MDSVDKCVPPQPGVPSTDAATNLSAHRYSATLEEDYEDYEFFKGGVF